MIDLKLHAKEIGRALRNGNFELTPGGVLIDRGGMNALANGAFKDTLYRGGERDSQISPNIVVNEWLTFMLNVMFNGLAPVTEWYVGIFSGNVTPVAGWTAAGVVAAATEITGYTPDPNRPSFDVSTTATPVLSNSGDEALFNFDGDGPYTARGAFLISVAPKGSTTGKLMAATRFAADRTGLISPDKLGVEYSVTASDAG